MPACAALAEGYSYPTVLPLIQQSLEAGSSVLLRGKPGVGKSSLAYELAREQFKLPVIDKRLAQMDPAEIGGVYVPDHATKTLRLYAPDWVREACEQPVFLFLDEINAAVSKLHQAAAYQIILEHRVGPFTFHEGTVVMAAGNLEEDEALAVPMSSALQNRFRHFILRVDAEAWLRWAAQKGLSPDVLAYVGFGGDKVLYNRTGEYAYPTPRSWADAAKVENLAVDPDQRRALVASCVGAAAATEFAHFVKVYKRVDVNAIVQRGEIPAMNVNTDVGFVYALTFAVGHVLRTKGIREAQLPNLYKLFTTPDFGPEFQILLVKNIEGSKAFEAIVKSPVFDPIKIRLTKLVMSAE